MNARHSGLLAIVVATAVVPAAAQTVDRYDMSRVGNHNADGSATYPAGVNDPSGWNPSAPPMVESAVPLPPSPETPLRSVPPGASAPWVPPSPQGNTAAQGNTAGPVGPAYGGNAPVLVPAVPAGSAGTPTYASPTQVYPPLSAAPVPTEASVASWYTRVDYFHWNEKVDGADFVNESGALFTVGYQRRIGIERFRAEVFGGEVHYDGYGQFDGNGINETLPSHTSYLGLRGEYEFVWEPAAWEGHVALLGGFGSRFWIRDLHDGTTPEGNPIYGYEETWWTFYPYLGAETHLPFQGMDLYSESRVGATVLTYDYATIGDRPMWPAPGLLANSEIGLRCTHFFAALRGEVMRWEDSAVVQGAYQPRATMYTVGGRLGFTF
jgi:hypothetical protein